MSEKADPFGHKQRWEKWKKTQEITTRYGEVPLSQVNRELIVEYLLDMEAGYNVTGILGAPQDDQTGKCFWHNEGWWHCWIGLRRE